MYVGLLKIILYYKLKFLKLKNKRNTNVRNKILLIAEVCITTTKITKKFDFISFT